MTLHVVLVHPRIPQNVGAVARVCAATKSILHVVRPVPFELSDRSLKRAGMDYMKFVDLRVHEDWEACAALLGDRPKWLLSSHGTNSLFAAELSGDDALLFGSEETGLPDDLMQLFANRLLRIPMLEPQARCLNLSTATAVVVYEALRKCGGLG
ncbi:tRNA (uridine(34)/cytosine(34)/5-carboxymethylaminomethyluridine(34)-2'-O)-methyltransferase TrmL [soil metagenome]